VAVDHDERTVEENGASGALDEHGAERSAARRGNSAPTERDVRVFGPGHGREVEERLGRRRVGEGTELEILPGS
jgi:hypothetical protein